jgi:hypothetical protein
VIESIRAIHLNLFSFWLILPLNSLLGDIFSWPAITPDIWKTTDCWVSGARNAGSQHITGTTDVKSHFWTENYFVYTGKFIPEYTQDVMMVAFNYICSFSLRTF